jgi:hypothetical protein
VFTGMDNDGVGEQLGDVGSEFGISLGGEAGDPGVIMEEEAADSASSSGDAFGG